MTTAISPASWEFSEGYHPDDEALRAARARAQEVGVSAVGAGAGSALTLLAGLTGARAVVEVGTGTGASGLCLLRGMAPDGVLTSIDLEAEHQRLARQTFTEAGTPSQRFRLIPGAALDVLPRLTDAHYDLIFADGTATEYPAYLEQALRLLRPGGVVAFADALGDDRVADPAQRDPATLAVREVVATVRDHEDLQSTLLPVGGGLLVARLRD